MLEYIFFAVYQHEAAPCFQTKRQTKPRRDAILRIHSSFHPHNSRKLTTLFLEPPNTHLWSKPFKYSRNKPMRWQPLEHQQSINKLFVVMIDLPAFNALNILLDSYKWLLRGIFRKPADVQFSFLNGKCKTLSPVVGAYPTLETLCRRKRFRGEVYHSKGKLVSQIS